MMMRMCLVVGLDRSFRSTVPPSTSAIMVSSRAYSMTRMWRAIFGSSILGPVMGAVRKSAPRRFGLDPI
jgi:hypothetical protein